MPRELSKAVLPEYVIEPPDIVVIDALHVSPRPPYHLRTQDALSIEVRGAFPEYPIKGVYPVQIGGIVSFGHPYGPVEVGGLTLEDARKVIQTHLEKQLKPEAVTVNLAQIAGQQQIAGEHLVKPDGTVTLGVYGSVPVIGLTIGEAKQAIEGHLAMFLEEPEVAVDVFAYNSKVYYVITEGAGLGDRVTRFPITGNETVLDAISNVSGLNSFSSTRIWIARATPKSSEIQILPVDWSAITSCGATATNYQIFPGDRVFIAENKLVALDTHLAKLLAPAERAMGFTLLTVGTLSRLSGKVLSRTTTTTTGPGF
jgi:protein involved in polysaccharide export with SLBB domain